jgi:hypothetical protein
MAQPEHFWEARILRDFRGDVMRPMGDGGRDGCCADVCHGRVARRRAECGRVGDGEATGVRTALMTAHLPRRPPLLRLSEVSLSLISRPATDLLK